jgi:hypothetical protein
MGILSISFQPFKGSKASNTLPHTLIAGKRGFFAALYSMKRQETDVFQAPGVNATDVAQEKRHDMMPAAVF